MQTFMEHADFILLNSAAHDCARNAVSTDTSWLNDVCKIRELNPSIKIVYKGGNYLTLSDVECAQLDVVAKQVMIEENVSCGVFVQSSSRA